MPRLFVALELPDAVTAELSRLALPAMEGVRRTEPEQMHLTLHYLGEFDTERTIAALNSVAAPPFGLTIQGVGSFHSKDQSTTLWAGVQESESLKELHRAVSLALVEVGFQAEARRYAPHVTLARCEPSVPAEAIADFQATNATIQGKEVAVETFGLHSSRFVDGVPEYRCEAKFKLVRNAGN